MGENVGSKEGIWHVIHSCNSYKKPCKCEKQHQAQNYKARDVQQKNILVLLPKIHDL